MNVVPNGLYGKLVLYVTLIMIAVISAFGFIIYKQQVSRIESTAHESVMLMAKNISFACANDVIVNDYENIDAYLKRFAELQNVLEIQIVNKEGGILSDVVHGNGLPPRIRYGSKPLSIPVSTQPSIQTEAEKIVALYPITAGKAILGWARLQYGLSEIPYIQKAILRNTVLASILGTFVSFLALLTVLKPPTRLITKIAYFAKKLDEVKGETIPVQHDFTEIEQLCEALNYASQKLYATERALMQHREHLEDLVTLRSAELAKTNEDLQQELAERKKTEEQIKIYSEDLAAVNEEMKNFAYIVSHDLRAPLVNIRGFSDELGRSIKEITPLLEEYRGRIGAGGKKTEEILKKDIPEALAFIGSSVTRMDTLINSILKLSRLGRNELKPELIHTEKLVQSLLKTLAHQIDKNKTAITVGRLPDIIMDKTAAEQLFGNLLDNAIKYLEPSRPGKIEITAEQNAGEITFAIRDNGRGIAKEDTQKVFELFRRVGKQDVPGEGIGLTYVKTLIRRLGGSIWCESGPGIGSVFRFTIPKGPMPADN